MNMERIVQFQPAFNRRDDDPNKNYEIHGVTLRMILKGNKGATQFVLYTNWQLPHVTKEFKYEDRFIYNDVHYSCRPTPADVGYHSLVPQYEGQTPMEGICNVLGVQCYCDGSFLQAEKVYERLLIEGDEGVWKELEDRYRSLFGDDNDQDQTSTK